MNLGLQRIALSAVVLAGVCLSNATAASASPSVWARARRPHAAEREMLVEQADKLLSDAALERERAELYSVPNLEDIMPRAKNDARLLLERAGGADSPNMVVRLRHASLLRDVAQDQKPRNMRDIESAAAILETVLSSRPPVPLALAAWKEMALCYALLGRREKEIRAYTEALALEVVGPRRASLLANRAESFMGLGRLEDAIQGYRDSLASLLLNELNHFGVTTRWGLAVALDRDGRLDEGLEQIRLARLSDPLDTEIKSDAWFYSPPYDEHWYKALGSWVKAREATNSIDRTFEYGHALEYWDRYVDKAPVNDFYVALAKVRRNACEIERERSARSTVGR
jgi:tetratricopeptide (TPR) repeat protein